FSPLSAAGWACLALRRKEWLSQRGNHGLRADRFFLGLRRERRPGRGTLPGPVRHPCLNEPPQAIHGLLSACPGRDAAPAIGRRAFFHGEATKPPANRAGQLIVTLSGKEPKERGRISPAPRACCSC